MRARQVKARLKHLFRKFWLPARHPRPKALPKRQDEWSIGIYVGESPYEFTSPVHMHNPVLTRADVSDAQAALVADPFMLNRCGTWYLFFEVMNQQTRKGEIGLATSENLLQWTYCQIVLAEPFHLSYPYVFEWMGEYFMIPESHRARSIRLYKASHFPTHWSFVTTLLSDGIFLDSSIFRYHDKWWMFTETNPQRKYDTLRLYFADDLSGPWHEHSRSPIIEGNPHIARPGGRVLVIDDRIIRYAQDCHPVYGTKVQAFEITELTEQHYRESLVREQAILAASGNDWNACGMHHIDPHRIDHGKWVASVDGFVWRDGLR